MEKNLKRNTIIFRVVFFFIVVGLIGQLFRIQILEKNELEARAEERNKITKTYKGQRGKILFADGSDLAVNQITYTIAVLPESFINSEVLKAGITQSAFLKDLSEMLQVDLEDLTKRVEFQGAKYVIARSRVTKEVFDKVASKYPQDLGLWTAEEQSQRIYPNKQLASKITGFVSVDDKGNEVGQYGLEQAYDGFLRGTEGVLVGERDGQNRIILNENFENINAKSGIDVTLTIDKGIQIMLEERLVYWLNEFKAKEATAVIMEPNTGRIIAMANVPTYDPNQYWRGEYIICDEDYDYYILHKDCNPAVENTPTPSSTETVSASPSQTPTITPTPTVDPRIKDYKSYAQEIFRTDSLPLTEVYRNAANSFVYEPGSVMKVITLAIAYDHNSIPRDPNHQLGGHGEYEQVLDQQIRAFDRKSKKSLTVKEMLATSDNIGALRIAGKMGVTEFANSLVKFGLTKPTGVELSDESVFNFLPIEQWTKVDQATASFGQGNVALTPIQLTHMWNILASGGKAYKPTIIKSLNDNGTVKDQEPQFLGQVVSADAAKDALDVASTTNTGVRSKNFHTKYPFSGKTGTADIPNPNGKGYLGDVVNTSFLGSGPMDEPKFTMLVWFREPRIAFEGGQMGATSTAQVAWLDIAERLMVKMNVVPANAKR